METKVFFYLSEDQIRALEVSTVFVQEIGNEKAFCPQKMFSPPIKFKSLSC